MEAQNGQKLKTVHEQGEAQAFFFFISTLTKDTNTIFLHNCIQYQNISWKLEDRSISDKKKNLSFQKV